MGKYIGAQSVYGAFEKQSITPDGVNNEFTLIYQAGSATSLLVVYSGVVQEPGVDYTLSDGGSKIVFSFIPTIGYQLYVVFLGRELSVPVSFGQFPVHHTGLGDNVTTLFTLPLSPLTAAALMVFKDGILQRHIDAWTISGADVNFVVAPGFGAKLDFYIHGIERNDLVTVDPLSITNDKIGPMSVTADKLNLVYTPYSPSLETFGGMTFSGLTIHEAEWIDTGQLIKLRLHLTLTVSGGDNKIRISLPINNSGSTNIAGNVNLSSATSLENGIAKWGDVGALDIYRQFGVNFTNEEWTCEINLEYESA